MSIINVVATPDRVTVATDTHCMFEPPDAPAVHASTSKMLVFPHMPMVIASRGYTLLPSMIFPGLVMLPDFDAVHDHFAHVLEATVAAAVAHTANCAPYVNADHEFVAAGWSRRRGRMDTVLWDWRDGICRAHGMRDFMTAPPPFEDPAAEIRPPQTTADYVALARHQAAVCRAHGGVGGGDLVLADVTADGIAIDVVRDFEGVRDEQRSNIAVLTNLMERANGHTAEPRDLRR